jgi:nucleoside-diphosphate-sugar epimerase
VDDLGRTLLVTGGAGFIGSNLIKRLLQEGRATSIVSVDNYFTGSPANHVADPRVTYVEGDTVDVSRIWHDLALPPPEVIYHLGEYSRIVQSFEERGVPQHFARWFDLDCVITYFYNVYGPGQITDGMRPSSASSSVSTTSPSSSRSTPVADGAAVGSS